MTEDKYDNGIITPRPPPQYRRVWGRDEVDDRDRDFYRPNRQGKQSKILMVQDTKIIQYSITACQS